MQAAQPSYSLNRAQQAHIHPIAHRNDVLSSSRLLALESDRRAPRVSLPLTMLEALDLHKNSIKVLPVGIGQMRSLMKFDLSENRLVELPPTICELNDNLQLAVGRNPLEKPTIEQARQGIGSIRRFFGYSKKKEEEGADDKEKIPPTKDDGEVKRAASKRPTGRPGGCAEPSRLGRACRHYPTLQLLWLQSCGRRGRRRFADDPK